MQEDHVWLSGPILRAARVLAGLSAREIAERAGLGEATVKRAEAAAGRPKMTRANAGALLAAYSALGIAIYRAEDGSVVLKGSAISPD